jgi:hypothetical protein
MERSTNAPGRIILVRPDDMGGGRQTANLTTALERAAKDVAWARSSLHNFSQSIVSENFIRFQTFRKL